MPGQKNGKIELYRFLFCVAVLLFHIGKYIIGEPKLGEHIHISLFPHGSMGVEFFFLTTGFFMAQTIYKEINREYNGQTPSLSLAESCTNFILHKYKRIFPEHAIAFIITIFAFAFATGMKTGKTVIFGIQNVPDFFLLQMSGLTLKSVNHVTWFLSSMMIAMAILYPIAKAHYNLFYRYLAPLISLLIIGYLQYSTKSLTGVETWIGFTYKANLRALAEIQLGGVVFEITREVKSKIEITRVRRIILTFLETGLLILIIFGMMLTWTKNYEVLMLVMLIILLVITGSRCSLEGG